MIEHERYGRRYFECPVHPEYGSFNEDYVRAHMATPGHEVAPVVATAAPGAPATATAAATATTEPVVTTTAAPTKPGA